MEGESRLAGREELRTTPVSALLPPLETTNDLVIGGQISPATIAGLCDRVRGLLQGGTRLIVCDVGGLAADAATIDALARAQLTARRLGGRIRLCNACVELRELVTLAGLSDVLPLGAPLLLEPRREAEEGEQARGVQEETDADDPAR
jgi:ABC-type transporter Mla MlaB component